MNGYIYKCLRILVLTFVLISTLTACGNKADNNGSMKAEDGRKYGGLIEASMGEPVKTAFFDMKIDSARKCGTYQFQDGLYIANEDESYLEVTITLTNTYGKDLPMSISDFTLDFSGNDSKDVITGYGSTDLSNNDFMDNIFTLKVGETITKSILYIVPDRAEYLLCYKEYYEDKFEGDSYEIAMVPEVLEPAVTTEAATESTEEKTEETTETDDNTEEPTESNDDESDNDDTGIDEQ